ncbi:MAG: helix-turn-helix transcriptional regulator [Proteobacteria bacterium]|nr:helix-turn-helix transcriptional regulator [Pseudomonadota bacterium]
MKCSKTLSLKDCGDRSACPLTNTLDIIGDKWTLIVIRDMLFLDSRQYNDFLESPEGISTNILADRLKKLEEYGIIVRKAYRRNPTRYEYLPTSAGEALRPVIMAIAGWGVDHIDGTRIPDEKELAEIRKNRNRKKT